MGAYTWQSFREIHEKYEAIAKGCEVLNLCPVIEEFDEDGKIWKFAGIWSKNRWEWHTTMLSLMAIKSTLVGFYDSQGDDAIAYQLDHTHI